ncbi:MAG: DUF2155 domain-containing protein [Rhodospirillaceae bacterium]|nr:DUF2155 domain-containing protein [Rhodospirillaceae bacterium]
MSAISARCTRVSAPLLAMLLLAPVPAGADFMDTAVLQGIDKVTARVSRIEVPIGRTVTFGPLEITAEACHKRPPEETPESAAFLVIAEQQLDEEPTILFSGWMFASSPALSALEHAVYDVWVVDCIAAATEESESSTGN